MIAIDHHGTITKWFSGQGRKQISLDETTEKELLLVIAAKLHSIRGMVMFFTVLTFLGIVSGIIALMLMTSR